MTELEKFSYSVSDNLFCLLYQHGYIDRSLVKKFPDLRKCEVTARLDEPPLEVANRLYDEFSKFMDNNGLKICPFENWNQSERLVFACERYDVGGVVDSNEVIFRTRAPFVEL